MIIQYESPEDKLAAILIQRKIGGRLARGFIEPSNLQEDIIILGGQIANATYKAFVTLNVLPEITEGMPGVITVTSYNNNSVYGVAGYTRADTIAAAEEIFLNGLPSQSMIITNPPESLALVTIPINPNNELLNAINNSIDNILNESNNILSSRNFTVDGIALNNTQLEFIIRKETGIQEAGFSDVITIIGFIIAAILIGIGTLMSAPAVIIIGGIVAAVATIQNIFTSNSPQKSAAAYSDIFDTLVEAGVSPELAAQIANQTLQKQGGDFSDNLLLIGGAILIVSGGIFLFQQLRKKK